MPTNCTYNLAQMPLSSFGLEVWITKRQRVQNVLVHHIVLGRPFVFRHGPANWLCLHRHPPDSQEGGRGEARDRGQREASGHPQGHGGGRTKQAGLFLPSVPTRTRGR